jgi:16S rRNA G966 N2-methylase RsmD
LWKIERSSVLAADGLVVLEHHHKLELSDAVGSLRKVRTVRAGESCLTFYKTV